MRSTCYLGMDLGGTSIKAAVVDVAKGTCLTKPIVVPTLVRRGRKVVLSQIADAAEQAVTSAGLRFRQLQGVGLAAPGPLSAEQGMLLQPVNLKPLWFVPIAGVLGECVGKPVTLLNDANAAAFGEYRAMGDAGGDLILLTLGTGIGGGIVVAGRILEGAFGNAAELGHLVVVPDGIRCGCGQRGCVEAYASAKAIVRCAKEEPSIVGSLAAGQPLVPLVVYQAMQQGNPHAERILDSACQHLAKAVVIVQHVVNPKTVVLGGGLVEMGSYFVHQVRKHAQRLTWRAAKDLPRIRRASLGNTAGLIGAAAWAAAT